MNIKLLWDIFILFTRVAMFSWGGGPASLALMQREVVAAGWVKPEEFADAVALSNALPGPIAPQVSAYIGYKIAGMSGAVSAVMGTILFATILMLIMLVYFFGVKDSPTIRAMLTAVRPLVVGLLLWTAYDMAINVFNLKKLSLSEAFTQGWDKLLITLVGFTLLTTTNINPVWLVVAAAVLGFFVYR